MRKKLSVIAISALCLCFALVALLGCSAVTVSKTPLADAVSGEQRSVLEGTGAKPVAAGCIEYRESGRHESIGYGKQAVQELRSYLNGIEVGAESDIMASDADTYYVFYFDDGSDVSFYTMLDQVSIDGTFYMFEAQGRAPEFAGDDNYLSSCPPTQELAQFVRRLESETPASISIEGPEGTFLAEGNALEALVDEFMGLSLYSAVSSEEFAGYIAYQNLAQTTYTFNWPDGSADTLRFMGDFLSVEYPDGFGTWGFYVGDLPRA